MIFFAFRSRFRSASNIWVTNISWWASTDCKVVLHTAFCPWCTNIIIKTRTDTLGIDTGTVVRTVIVTATTNDITTYMWVSSVTT